MQSQQSKICWFCGIQRGDFTLFFTLHQEDISDKPKAAKDAEICRREIIPENYSINEQYQTELATILQATDFDSAEVRVTKIKYKQKDNRYTNFFRIFCASKILKMAVPHHLKSERRLMGHA